MKDDTPSAPARLRAGSCKSLAHDVAKMAMNLSVTADCWPGEELSQANDGAAEALLVSIQARMETLHGDLTWARFGDRR